MLVQENTRIMKVNPIQITKHSLMFQPFRTQYFPMKVMFYFTSKVQLYAG